MKDTKIDVFLSLYRNLEFMEKDLNNIMQIMDDNKIYVYNIACIREDIKEDILKIKKNIAFQYMELIKNT